MVSDFDRVHVYDRHPRYEWYWAEDDGLEKYYVVPTSSGEQFLLSNNMTYKDRTEFYRLYMAHDRVHNFAYLAGIWLSAETVLRVPYFKSMPVGWRFVSFLGLGLAYRGVFNYHNSYRYQPLLGAYLRKYQHKITPDRFEMRDEKREFYEIDTSQYMSYTVDDVKDYNPHMNLGPHPDFEFNDNSWLTELQNFLDGKENHLKKHSKFLDHKFELHDKSFPSSAAADELIKGPAPPRM